MFVKQLQRQVQNLSFEGIWQVCEPHQFPRLVQLEDLLLSSEASEYFSPLQVDIPDHCYNTMKQSSSTCQVALSTTRLNLSASCGAHQYALLCGEAEHCGV
jgi:hypothetical protein